MSHTVAPARISGTAEMEGMSDMLDFIALRFMGVSAEEILEEDSLEAQLEEGLEDLHTRTTQVASQVLVRTDQVEAENGRLSGLVEGLKPYQAAQGALEGLGEVHQKQRSIGTEVRQNLASAQEMLESMHLAQASLQNMLGGLTDKLRQASKVGKYESALYRDGARVITEISKGAL